MKESKQKKKVFFTIDPILYQKLEDHMEQKMIKQSKLIETLIKDYLIKNNLLDE